MRYHNCSIQRPRYGHIEVVLDGKRRHQRSANFLFHRYGQRLYAVVSYIILLRFILELIYILQIALKMHWAPRMAFPLLLELTSRPGLAWRADISPHSLLEQAMRFQLTL